ncbi:putative ABC transporter permease protein YurN [Spirochaetia bacterium]|nr:putative ABC transporter permease protein YurN [Spirochaetia bacterium]
MQNTVFTVKPKKLASVRRSYMLIGFCFLAPAIAVYLLFMAYPLYRTFALSLTNWSGFGPVRHIGFVNFKNMAGDPTFWRALKNTLYFAFFSAVFSVLIGLVMAWLNLYMQRMEGQVFRTILFSPSIIAPTITGLLFVFIFTEELGLLNNILRLAGLANLTTSWLTNMATVKQVIVIATIWRQFGLCMVLCYAGLQRIPGSMIECSRLDGAGDFRIFTRILVPLIKPQIELSMMFTMLGGLRIYDSVVALTGGGPARQTVVLPMWIVENAFAYSKYGYASSLCVAFVFVVLIFIILLRLFFRGEIYEY